MKVDIPESLVYSTVHGPVTTTAAEIKASLYPCLVGQCNGPSPKPYIKELGFVLIPVHQHVHSQSPRRLVGQCDGACPKLHIKGVCIW